jgi:hypothetical protein
MDLSFGALAGDDPSKVEGEDRAARWMPLVAQVTWKDEGKCEFCR